MTPERWQTAKEVFHEVLNFSAKERELWLNQLGDDEQELRLVVERLAEIRAHRAAMLSENEARLLQTINQGLPPEVRSRLDELHMKRADETLAPDEHAELLSLQQQLEALHAARVEALGKLARLRGVTLTEMMNRLGIRFPDYV